MPHIEISTTQETTLADILPLEFIKRNEITGCINWFGKRDYDGYGLFRPELYPRMDRVHRIVFRALNGVIPAGKFITHKCDNPSCCNPDHLEIGDAKSNNKARVERGRSNNGENNGQAKLTEEQAIAIKRHKGTNESIATFLGISQKQVRRIKNNEQWESIPDDGRKLPKYLEEFLTNPPKYVRNYKDISGENSRNARLTRQKVIAIRRYKGTTASIAFFLGISKTAAQAAKRNASWKDVVDTGEELPEWIEDFLNDPVLVKKSSKKYPTYLKINN